MILAAGADSVVPFDALQRTATSLEDHDVNIQFATFSGAHHHEGWQRITRLAVRSLGHL